MARKATRTSRNGSVRETVGLGFLPAEARHGFLIEIPKGTARNEFIRITEHRHVDLSQSTVTDRLSQDDKDPSLRVLIDRGRWLALAPAFWEEANRRLRANGTALAHLPAWASFFMTFTASSASALHRCESGRRAMDRIKRTCWI